MFITVSSGPAVFITVSSGLVVLITVGSVLVWLCLLLTFSSGLTQNLAYLASFVLAVLGCAFGLTVFITNRHFWLSCIHCEVNWVQSCDLALAVLITKRSCCLAVLIIDFYLCPPTPPPTPPHTHTHAHVCARAHIKVWQKLGAEKKDTRARARARRERDRETQTDRDIDREAE